MIADLGRYKIIAAKPNVKGGVLYHSKNKEFYSIQYHGAASNGCGILNNKHTSNWYQTTR